MASASIGQRSVRFVSFDEEIKDYDIVRALLVSFDEEEIERVQAMYGWLFLEMSPLLRKQRMDLF